MMHTPAAFVERLQMLVCAAGTPAKAGADEGISYHRPALPFLGAHK